MLPGFVGWPEDAARRYREAGLWEGLTVAEMVARSAARDPGKVAVVYGDRRITYRELVAGSRRLALGLLRLGLGPMDRTVMQLPNIPEFVTTYLALNWIGVIPVMALRAHRQAEVRHFIRASGASAYFIPDVAGGFDYRDMAAGLAAEFPLLRHGVVDGQPRGGQTELASHVARDATDQEVASALRAARPSAGDVSTMAAAVTAHKADDAAAFREAAAAFRVAWLVLVPNPRLVRVVEQCSDHMQHIRAMTMGDPKVRWIVLKGLKQIAMALAKGDGEAAAAAMHENLRQAKKAFIRASGLDQNAA